MPTNIRRFVSGVQNGNMGSCQRANHTCASPIRDREDRLVSNADESMILHKSTLWTKDFIRHRKAASGRLIVGRASVAEDLHFSQTQIIGPAELHTDVAACRIY